MISSSIKSRPYLSANPRVNVLIRPPTPKAPALIVVENESKSSDKYVNSVVCAFFSSFRYLSIF